MAAGDGQSRHQPGGIIGLAEAVKEHRGAIEYDLLTRTGYDLRDVGDALSWGAFDAFMRHPQLDSALFRELAPELADWATRLKTNTILADIWDQLALINANLVSIGNRKPAVKPTPYKRPGKKDKDTKTIGSEGLPPDELHEWIRKKAQERRAGTYARNSTGDDHRHSSPAGSAGETDK